MESRALALNQVIAGKRDNLPSGFGYIQLLTLLNTLERRIREARQDRLISTKSGRRDDSQAIDMFLQAKDRVLNARTSRNHVWRLKQAAERFSIGGKNPKDRNIPMASAQRRSRSTLLPVSGLYRWLYLLDLVGLWCGLR
ncbi:hypothetical protein E5D57_004430 [Metarhizium anisopliae]|nr:hypothetical protein E5D57_004430 [Metarhizium anisopliae]